MARTLRHISLFILTVQIIYLLLVPVGAAEESRDCREQEYRDLFGTCKACEQCDAGQELSKECGFGYGVDARCVACRSARFKEDRGLQKCKPCLDCGLVNRFQKANCSATRNAACGDCLPGFYRKTKLSGFQEMECIPCGDPPPPYELHCGGRVDRVPLPSVASSPRDVALAAVICSALATVLLALLVLCVIYCKRQLLEKKPGASMRLQDGPYHGAELSCLDRRWLPDFPDHPCCQCHLGPGHTCGPVHLIPSLCWDDGCHLGPDGRAHGAFHSQGSLSYRIPDQDQYQDRDPDRDQDRDRAGLEPHPGSVSAEARSPELSESPVTPQRRPGMVPGRGGESGEEEEEEEVEVEQEEEEVEERYRSGEDIVMSAPDRSSLEG